MLERVVVHRRMGTQPEDRIGDCLAAARAGSREALGRLLELCRPYLLLVSNRACGSDLQAKGGPSDLVQQTFLEAQHAFDRFHGTTEAELLAWLRRILLHNVANFSRHYRDTDKRRIDSEIPLDLVDPEEALARGPSGRVPSPSAAAMAAEQLEALERALARLPDDYRRVIALHHREERTFEEIGTLMGRSAEAVRKLWSRAIDRLQEELGDAP